MLQTNELDRKWSLTVMDVQGRIVLEYDLRHEERHYIDLGDIPSGVYHLLLSSDGILETYPLVIPY